MGKSNNNKSVSKKSQRQVETTISMASSSLSSISNPSHLRSASLSTCFIICAFISIAILSSLLTYAATKTFMKCKEYEVAGAAKNEDLTKIYQFMDKMDKWFVTHNYYYITPENVTPSNKCGSSACDYKQRPPAHGWPKLPKFEWKEMNESPYPHPKASSKSCNINNNSTAAA